MYPSRRRKSPLPYIILTFLAIVIFLGVRSYINGLYAPVDPNGKIQVFVIQPSDNLSTLADRLKQAGLIKSPWAFKNAAKDLKVAPGDFKLSPAMTLDEIVKYFKDGSIDRRVTLLEGWRVEELALKLNKELGVDQQQFITQAKEGYMFPDTYFFNPNVSISDIVATLRRNFDQKYSDGLQAQIKARGLTPAQGVILASIVEREARSDGARQMVASILLKRIKIGMGLNADSTIQYALGYQPPEDSWWKRHLSRSDLKVDSLYNTYLYAGLPPGPICNPSLSSLKAVASADSSTPYLYYYHDSQGVSHYAKTLEEHNQNVADYP